MNLLETGKSVLAEAGKRAPQAQAEAFLLESVGRTYEWSEGVPENTFLSAAHGLGLRLIDQGRLGFGHTNRLDASAVQGLVETASAATRLTAPDPLLELPDAKRSTAPDLELTDPALHTGREERWEFLSGVEAEVKRRDRRFTKVLRATYREGTARTAVVSTRGVEAGYEGTSASFTVACVAVENGETQIGYGFQAVRHYNDLKRDWVVDKAVEGTLALLGGKQIPSGRYDVVLDPFVAAEMLELVAAAIRADQVQKGKSFFAGKVGQAVGAPCVTLVDDGRLKRGLGSSPFDAEGVPTQRTVLLKEGVLQGFLYDSYWAKKGGTVSTGNAGRGSYKGSPEPEANNFYLEPGKTSPEQLITSIRSGIYVRNVMGLHTVDTISGDYSLGLMGQRIENGKLTHGVRGVTIAGNLLELLKNVEAVGSDLTFAGSVGSPTLWIREVSVGGS